ncbi:hypothetical protein GN244_ATG09184 [Phytophthora infestans]|uniref:Uncharacterized protein n=1 Tax=Phytophthora infestans TaxID=4787 RepID=A0A833W1N0_PHYIN|nr:hypothetical protein GN244_ATG09184 [Phytophthora infestans]KAF4142548.1 hypothetical protein GN958_ATG08279 [Phytophthora infestans]
MVHNTEKWHCTTSFTGDNKARPKTKAQGKCAYEPEKMAKQPREIKGQCDAAADDVCERYDDKMRATTSKKYDKEILRWG